MAEHLNSQGGSALAKNSASETNAPSSTRLRRELRTVEAMLQIYCRAKHKSRVPCATIASNCETMRLDDLRAASSDPTNRHVPIVRSTVTSRTCVSVSGPSCVSAVRACFGGTRSWPGFTCSTDAVALIAMGLWRNAFHEPTSRWKNHVAVHGLRPRKGALNPDYSQSFSSSAPCRRGEYGGRFGETT